MIPFLKKLGTKALSVFTGVLLRLVTLLSLVCTVLCCALFIYGLFIQSIFYCVSCVIGGAVFTWINKQT